MISEFYGRKYPLQFLREKCNVGKQGATLLSISEAAEQIGFGAVALKINLLQLAEVTLPCIVHWRQDHYIIVYRISKNKIYVCDPARGKITYSKDEFLDGWVSDGQRSNGVALILKPQANFFQQTNGDSPGKIKLKSILLYFLRYKRLFFLLLLGLGIGTILQLVIPFFTQAVVDTGIASSDLNFIYLILLGQLMIFVGSTVVDFTKSWILLHVSTRINLSLVSEYWIKLMKLPLAYFDTRMTGDVLQRLSDHKRIESFLTGPAISVVFTFTNLIVFSFVIVSYDLVVFGVFLAGSLLYFLWIFLFMKARRSLDFTRLTRSYLLKSLN